ncbi:MAG: hypothetical protein U9R24_07345, partial [Thermodesulfobacteriota bacterium]|nr:hypothetical protein [Thermodesulfobacteriota bacterium]
MKKLSYAFVKDQIGLAGYKLLSDNYLGAYSPLQIMCPNGHKFELSWNSWKKGRRCKYCKGALYIPKLQHDLSVNGYELITDPTLITAKKDHFDVICPEGHKNSITANSWYKGTRCRDCYFNTIKITLTSLMILLESKGFTLID